MIPQPYPIQHSTLVHLRQDQMTRELLAVIDRYGLFLYAEKSHPFFHCLSSSDDWIGFDSFLFFFLFSLFLLSRISKHFVAPTVCPRRDTWSYCLVWLFYLHHMHPKPYTYVGCSWMLLQYANLFLWFGCAISFSFPYSMRKFAFRGWLLVLLHYSSSLVWAVFGGLVAVNFLLGSFPDWTGQINWDEVLILLDQTLVGMVALGFVHKLGSTRPCGFVGPSAPTVSTPTVFIRAGRYQTKIIQKSN